MAQGPCAAEQAQGSTDQGQRPIAQGPGPCFDNWIRLAAGLAARNQRHGS